MQGGHLEANEALVNSSAPVGLACLLAYIMHLGLQREERLSVHANESKDTAKKKE
jgi:hypothetical protein